MDEFSLLIRNRIRTEAYLKNAYEKEKKKEKKKKKRGEENNHSNRREKKEESEKSKNQKKTSSFIGPRAQVQYIIKHINPV